MRSFTGYEIEENKRMKAPNFKKHFLLGFLILIGSLLIVCDCAAQNQREAVISVTSPGVIYADPPSDQTEYRFPARVQEMVDGDTGWFIVQVPSLISEGNFKDFEKVRVKVRLWKCNTSETNTNIARFDGWSRSEKADERKKGRDAKKWAIKNFNGLKVTLVYKDKYFDSRWVAEVVCPDGETMKSKLRKAGHLDGKYEN